MLSLSQKNVNRYQSLPELVDKFCTKVEKLLHKKAAEYHNADLLVHQKKLTPGLKEIRELFKKLLMIHKKVTVYDTANMLDDLKKVIEGLKEIRKIFMNSGYHNIQGEALIRIVLKMIIQEVSKYLRTDYGRVSLPAMKRKAKLDQLNRAVSNLKLQLLLLSIFEQSNASPTVSEINEIIIPAVVARLELAFYPLHPLVQDNYDYQRTRKEMENVTNDLSYIRSSINNLDNSIYSYKRDILKKFVGGNAREFVISLLRFSDLVNFGITYHKEKENLSRLCYAVREIRLQISFPIIVSRSNLDECYYSQVFDTEHHEDIKQSSAYRVFKVFYESLELTTKLCLLCFAVIPENEVVKKRFMTYWWVGEGFVTPSVLEGQEDIADRIFQELEKKRFIVPVNDNYRPHVVDSYTMNPLTRSFLIMHAKDSRFFYFDEHKRNPTFNFERSYRACLAKVTYQNDVLGLDPEKLRTIFNVNEPYPDRSFKGKRVSKFKNVKVLYLGGWRQSSAENHIEVESIEFLKGLKSMKLLRLFSLQGISMITQLPDSICKLLNLIILDLRACHNLEKLPRGIGSLKMLTHLDVSKCYMLQYMPKGIALLSQLQVLKGFVITDIFHPESCTLYDLVRLDKLRKFNIYTNRKDFPKDTEVTTFTKFEVLQKLTITWGAGAVVSTEQADSHASQDKVAIFETLEKLVLEGYPSKTAPGLLLPAKLPKLKKLYIRGGKLQNLTNQVEENDKWPTVQVLRLKFLRELKMDWKKIWSSSFPSLIYLEIFECASFITDGVFRSAEAMNRKME